MSVKSELEFKQIMEKRGWKVKKIRGDTKLNSKNIGHNTINFIAFLKAFFGETGLPDFFVFKNKINEGGFIEVKYKGKLTKSQEITLNQIKNFLNMWVYVVNKK